MILSKASRLPLLAALLCLLLMGFTGAANAVIRWDVFPSPTEVINTGRSEVLGSVTLVVSNNQLGGALTVQTGNILGGPTQIGILYNNGIMIDTTNTSGIRLYSNNALLTTSTVLCTTACNPNTQFFVTAQNIDPTGTGTTFAGLITINIPGGVTLGVGDVIRVDGVRGRIDKSQLITPNTDGYCQLQSINDPAGNQFFPETIRIAKSFLPFTVAVTSDVATLCLPPFGGTGGAQPAKQVIKVQENFVRAFVAKDSIGTVGPDSSDRLDSNGQILGGPTQGTQLKVFLNSIPAVVTGVSWPTPVLSGIGSEFRFVAASDVFKAGAAGANPAAGSAFAIYEYFTSNQAGASDANTETFNFTPALTLSTTNQQDIAPNAVRAGVSLWPPPPEDPITTLYQPYATTDVSNKVKTPAAPRFLTQYVSGSVNVTDPLGSTATTSFGIYETFSPCVCYLMFPFTTVTTSWNTGLAVANTSDDSGAITSGGAPDQAGTVTFWLYDYRLGNITPAAGVFYADNGSDPNRPAHKAPPTQSGPAFDANGQPIYYAGQTDVFLLSSLTNIAAVQTVLKNNNVTDFQGYLIAKANFQYCHGYAFIADPTFANIAQGYVASVIPDPAVKGGRLAAAAADAFKTPAGESLNN